MIVIIYNRKEQNKYVQIIKQKIYSIKLIHKNSNSFQKNKIFVFNNETFHA